MPTEEEFEELSRKVEELSTKYDELNERTPGEEMHPPADPSPPKSLSFTSIPKCWAPPVKFVLKVEIGFGSPDPTCATGDPMTRIANLDQE